MSSMKISQKIRLLKSEMKSHALNLDGLNRLSKERQNNPVIAYLDINSLRNKVNDLRQICGKTQMHLL